MKGIIFSRGSVFAAASGETLGSNLEGGGNIWCYHAITWEQTMLHTMLATVQTKYTMLYIDYCISSTSKVKKCYLLLLLSLYL